MKEIDGLSKTREELQQLEFLLSVSAEIGRDIASSHPTKSVEIFDVAEKAQDLSEVVSVIASA